MSEKLTGDALEAALTERGLSNDGTADERRARVAEYDAAKAATPPSDTPGATDQGTQTVTGDPRADLYPPSETASQGQGAAEFKGGDTGLAVQTDQGPGTPNAVTPEHTARPIASTADVATSGPLEPPRDAVLQTDPPQGYSAGTTDQVFGRVGGRTIAGESYEGLVTEDDSPVTVDDLFSDEDSGKTFVVVTERIYEVFYYPNTTEKCKRLLYVPGQRVNRADAERVKQAVTASESGDRFSTF